MSELKGYSASGEAWDDMMLRQGRPATAVWKGRRANVMRGDVRIGRITRMHDGYHRAVDVYGRYIVMTMDEALAVHAIAQRDDKRIANATLID